MKITANVINTLCISMYEAVTVPSLMMMTSIVSEELLVRNTHTDTDRLRSIFTFLQNGEATS